MNTEFRQINYTSRVLIHSIGQQLVEHLGMRQETSEERAGGFVARIEKEMDKQFLSKIKILYPNHSFVTGSESKKTEGAEYTWHFASLDGTKYYIRKIPVFAVSLGLVYKQELVFGIVYNPISHQMYWGTAADNFIHRNYEKIVPEKKRSLREAIITTDYADLENTEEDEKEWIKEKSFQLIINSYRVRSFGCAPLALAWLATGGLDVFVDLTGRRYPIPMKAGLALIKSAGGLWREIKIKGFSKKRLVVGLDRQLVDSVCNILQS